MFVEQFLYEIPIDLECEFRLIIARENSLPKLNRKNQFTASKWRLDWAHCGNTMIWYDMIRPAITYRIDFVRCLNISERCNRIPAIRMRAHAVNSDNTRLTVVHWQTMSSSIQSHASDVGFIAAKLCDGSGIGKNLVSNSSMLTAHSTQKNVLLKAHSFNWLNEKIRCEQLTMEDLKWVYQLRDTDDFYCRNSSEVRWIVRFPKIKIIWGNNKLVQWKSVAATRYVLFWLHWSVDVRSMLINLLIESICFSFAFEWLVQIAFCEATSSSRCGRVIESIKFPFAFEWLGHIAFCEAKSSSWHSLGMEIL